MKQDFILIKFKIDHIFTLLNERTRIAMIEGTVRMTNIAAIELQLSIMSS